MGKRSTFFSFSPGVVQTPSRAVIGLSAAGLAHPVIVEQTEVQKGAAKTTQQVHGKATPRSPGSCHPISLCGQRSQRGSCGTGGGRDGMVAAGFFRLMETAGTAQGSDVSASLCR